jgi:hypothetical protein
MEKIMGFCDSVTVEKRLKIRNPRLGIIKLTLQIGALIVVILMAGVSRQYETTQIPDGNGIEMWASPGESAQKSKMTEPHCSNPGSYLYQYSSTFTYNPSECKPLPSSEAYTKNGLNLYFPTYIDEDFSTQINASNCASLFCDSAVGEVKTDDGIDCKCDKLSKYFVQNPEENILHINHGFMVYELDQLTGRPLEKPVKHKSNALPAEEKFEMKTIITKAGDREKKCEVGGKSEWKRTDAENGISGTLKEWIACGSDDAQSLEAYSENSKGPGMTTAPHTRITGMQMSIKLVYDYTEGYDDVTCYVIVDTTKQFNTQTSVAYTLLPSPQAPFDQIYRRRYNYGIGVTISATGEFKFTDFTTIILIITSSLVILSLPQTMITFLTMNGVGRLSKIYSANATERFGILDRLHCVCARTLGWKTMFDNMNLDKGVLTGKSVHDDLHAILKPTDDLGEGEIESMANIVVGEMAGDGGSISLQQYLRACNENENVKLKDIATFFDENAKVPILEKIFSDFHSRMNKRKEQYSGVTRVVPAAEDPEAPPAPEAVAE